MLEDTQVITVTDNEPPSITCPPEGDLTCGEDGPAGNTGVPIVDDNCDPDPWVSHSDGPINGDCPSFFIRTWTAVDICGNANSCDQTIYINDDESPEISCPMDYYRYLQRRLIGPFKYRYGHSDR